MMNNCEEYLERQIPGFKNILSLDEIEIAYSYYTRGEYWGAQVKINRSYNDENNEEKNMDRQAKCQNNLRIYIEKLKEKYGISKPTVTEVKQR